MFKQRSTVADSVTAIIVAWALGGCSSYQTPGAGADVKGLFPPAVEEATEPGVAAMLAVTSCMCVSASFLSIARVTRIEPAMVFKA